MGEWEGHGNLLDEFDGMREAMVEKPKDMICGPILVHSRRILPLGNC